MELGDIYLYRMTHIENIPHILQYGITHRSSENANPDFFTIGDLSLIDTRSKKVVRVDNGDYQRRDPPTIILGDYIPFYFGVRMPMLLVIQNGGNFVERATPAQNIVYLACSLSNIVNSEMGYYFTDGHATDSLTTFYDNSKINELPTIVDWDSVKASYWGGIENLDVKRKKQAEFLVSSDLPPNCIDGFVCKNRRAQELLVSMGISEQKIRIRPKAYY